MALARRVGLRGVGEGWMYSSPNRTIMILTNTRQRDRWCHTLNQYSLVGYDVQY